MRRRRKPPPAGVLYLDLRPMVAVFAEFSRRMARLQRALSPTPADRLEHRRSLHGGNRSDARYHPDAYLTACCAAMLCRSTGFRCKSDDYDLQCICRCHEKG
jgi:hypothetical protein